ncbi:hypothetical protein SKAU_G00236580 [Synaphobranchus kaupii]|uniref:Uncharacterized protein n=1 Tax=Synaphobranchus kaupii TaxID=118154 RepID=A0A9Q1ITG4_SYNKA|nr:hypothetical protein SKAU_G00236580 [Synaphobranchus kaupii]
MEALDEFVEQEAWGELDGFIWCECCGNLRHGGDCVLTDPPGAAAPVTLSQDTARGCRPSLLLLCQCPQPRRPPSQGTRGPAGGHVAKCPPEGPSTSPVAAPLPVDPLSPDIAGPPEEPSSSAAAGLPEAPWPPPCPEVPPRATALPPSPRAQLEATALPPCPGGRSHNSATLARGPARGCRSATLSRATTGTHSSTAFTEHPARDHSPAALPTSTRTRGVLVFDPGVILDPQFDLPGSL